MVKLPQSISATIEVAPTEHKLRAWLIFRELYRARTSFAENVKDVFLNSLEVEEEIYENKISFNCSFFLMTEEYNQGISAFFSDTGLLQPIDSQLTWKEYSDSIRHLQPFQGNGTDRGVALLSHDFRNERIIDLCDNNLQTPAYENATRGNPDRAPIGVLCNKKPSPNSSWLKFKAKFLVADERNAKTLITLGPDDASSQDFDPTQENADIPNVSSEIKRFQENNAGKLKFRWTGFAERVGYNIPRPSKARIDGKLFKPVGGRFQTELVGYYFCQPLYRAMWDMEYVMIEQPTNLDADDSNPIAEENA